MEMKETLRPRGALWKATVRDPGRRSEAGRKISEAADIVGLP